MTTRRFQIQPDMTIANPDGTRAKIVMIQAFPNLLVLDEPSRANWDIRNTTAGTENYNITPASGKSKPTGFARYTWRNKSYVHAKIGGYHARGWRGIRTGVDPAMFNTDSYVDPDDGITYPSDLEMCDAIVDSASQYEWMVNLTMACSFAPTSVVNAFLVNLANRYKDNGNVVFNPSNEINCGNGSGACANASLWASAMAGYINSIRSTGAKNLIILNPTGQATGNPASGFSMVDIIPYLSSPPFSNDPNLAYGIHHYRYPSGPAFSATQEDNEWGNYLSTYPIVIEECGISADVGHVYDPDMNETTSYNITEWNALKLEHGLFLDYCRAKMDNDNLSMITCGVDSFYFGGTHLDLSTKRLDGTLTTQGKLIVDKLISGPPAAPVASWHTVYTTNPTGVGGADINGYNMRIAIPGSVFPQAYSKIRFTYKPCAATYGLNFSSIYLANQATQGAGIDVGDAVTFTQVLNGGAASLVMSAGATAKTLDEVVFSGTANQALILSHAVGGSMRSSYSSTTGFQATYKAASAASVNTANITGYSTDANIAPYLSKIEVYY